MKLAWLAGWCAAQGLYLQLDGEVGFGRECVGILDGASYVDFDTYDEETFEPLPGQEGLIPGAEAPEAYGKHDCLAVLGRGPESESQLYAWVRRLSEAGARIEKNVPKTMPDLGALVGITTRTRIVLPFPKGE